MRWKHVLYLRKGCPLPFASFLTKKVMKVGFFRDVTKTGNGKMKNGNKTQLEHVSARPDQSIKGNEFSLGPSVSMEISRQFVTMESTPSMPLSFI